MSLNSHLESNGIRFDKTEVYLQPLPVELCDECQEAPATHYLAINLRALGTEGAQLGESKLCEPCGKDALRDFQATLPEPLNEDGTF